MPLDRRRFVIASAAAGLAGRAVAATVREDLVAYYEPRFAAVEAKTGGRLGVYAYRVGWPPEGEELQRSPFEFVAWRADEHFPMCSTFKAMNAAALLKRVDDGAEHLDRFVPYSDADLLPYAPTTRAHLAEGGMKVGDLCQAMLQLSDNGAANLILKAVGGPPAWTQFVHSLGDDVSRLDRTEPTLNTSIPGDLRDTTTPQYMAHDLARVLLGDVLKVDTRQQLKTWMLGCKTGEARLRRGLPKDWLTADKTGTGDNGTANDIAVAWKPWVNGQQLPVAVACYLTGATEVSADEREAAIAAVGKLVGDALEIKYG